MRMQSDALGNIVLVPETDYDNKALNNIINNKLTDINSGWHTVCYALSCCERGDSEGWFNGERRVVCSIPYETAPRRYRVLLGVDGLELNMEGY